MSRDLGDWQTPTDLAATVLELLARRGVKWSRVLEPTCGTGSFVTAALMGQPAPAELIGLDIQAHHIVKAKAALSDSDTRIRLLERNIFDLDLALNLEWETDGPLLVVGNPPWVTNAELGSLNSGNRPRKRNLKGMRGLDAITGSANFDIAECITLKLLTELTDLQPTVALLLKTTVARNVLQHAVNERWPVKRASIHRFDARRTFGAAVDACLLIMECGGDCTIREVPVFGSLSAEKPLRVMGFRGASLVADISAYRRVSHLDGVCPVTWRQGVKHDAASVLELEQTPSGSLKNRFGEQVEVESEFLFPLIKCTQLNRGETSQVDRWIILPQRDLKFDTLRLRDEAPKLWAYLTRHQRILDARRSRIYRGRPPFAIFGVGDYTFTDYKIAISGLHKEPAFRWVGPIAGKPVILDDTSYLLPCVDAPQAAALLALLTGPGITLLLQALMFPDSRRGR